MVDSPTVLHVSQPTDGGVARLVIDLAKAQADNGWRVCVASPPDSAYVAQLRASNVFHYRWHAARDPGPSVLGEVRALRAIERRIRPDLMHLHSSKAGFAGRLRLRRGIPTIFQPHGWSFEAVDGTKAYLSLLWERLAAPRTDVLLCVSDSERARAQRAGLRGRFEVVRNGVDLARFPFVDQQERAEARARLGLDSRPLAVCIGRLCRAKGQDVLLAAWSSVRSAIPDAHLVLVGEGPDRSKLEASADSTVQLAGYRDDVPDWLAAADVVVVPSRWEALPYAALEAMAVGRCVIATQVDGVEEALDDTGVVVALNNTDALASAIVSRLRDPAISERERQRARARVEERHDARRQLARVLDLSARLIDERVR